MSQEIQERDIINFDKLSKGAMFRYQAYFGIDFENPEKLKENIEQHFYEDFVVDEKMLLGNF